MYLRGTKKTSLNVSISEPIDTDKNGSELTILDIISCEDTIADDLDTKLKCQMLSRFISCQASHPEGDSRHNEHFTLLCIAPHLM